MSRRAAGVTLAALAVVLFLSRYVIALWYRGAGHSTWGADDFANYLGYVGAAPWGAAAVFLLGGIYFLVRADLDD